MATEASELIRTATGSLLYGASQDFGRHPPEGPGTSARASANPNVRLLPPPLSILRDIEEYRIALDLSREQERRFRLLKRAYWHRYRKLQRLAEMDGTALYAAISRGSDDRVLAKASRDLARDRAMTWRLLRRVEKQAEDLLTPQQRSILRQAVGVVVNAAEPDSTAAAAQSPGTAAP